MKKRLIVFLTAAIMLLCTTVFCVVGCGSGDDDSNAPKVEYNLTVLAPDKTPVQGVTVSWQKSGKTKGSAKTDENGIATAKIAEGTYNVVISGLEDRLTYSNISITPDMRVGASVTLSVKRVIYTAEVKDKTGAPAQNVTVTWSNDDTVVTAVTDGDGKASCELDYDDYTVTVSNLPNGNIYTDTKTATGKVPNAIIELRNGEAVEYSVTVRSEGGLKFTDLSVFVLDGTGRPQHTGKTGADGVLAFSLPAGDYTVSIPSIQEGYTITKTARLTAAALQDEVVLSSAVIEEAAPSDKIYKIGDIIHDYVWTTPYEVDGARKEYSIAELLETKEAVIINNWGTKCTYCVKEMPAMDEVYQNYSEQIELLAISNYMGGDSESLIASYREANDYTFPMMRDTNSFVTHFQITDFPTTIVIDRYGAIAHIEAGAIPDAEIWERLIKRFIGDDYVQTFTPGEDSEPITTEMSKPDITVPADHYEKVAAAINNFEATDDMYVNWYGETENEYMWPFILKTEEGVSEDDEVLCSSNAKKPNSMSALYATVKMPVGKLLAFDYYSQTETDTDILSAVWDGKMVIKEISGNSRGWKTCYLYSVLAEGEHGLALSYIKDSTVDVGLDNVYIRNVRFEDMSAMDEVLDMPRTAAYGTPTSGEYPYYAGVELVDGYYHIVLDSLQNSMYAGNDEKPMLFVNMLGATNWNGRKSIATLITELDDAGEYANDCRFSVNGGAVRDYRPDLVEYCSVAAASDIYGFLPVDEELRDILSAFMAKVEGKAERANGWLELCFFYSHYGDDGEYIGNPILGLTEKTAIPVEVDTVFTADLTHVMGAVATRIYTFTPDESAVYKIESLLPEGDTASQVWLYDDDTDPDNALAFSGDDRFVRDGVNEQNFVVYRYLTAGHKYYIEVALLMQDMGELDFKVTNAGQSVTELVQCSEGVFNLILSSDGETILGVELADAVEYGKDEQGYYHVKNADGSLGSYIYLDVKYPSQVSPTLSIEQLVNQKLKVPTLDEYCDYDVFNLQYRIAYYTDQDDENVVNYVAKFDLTQSGIDRDFKDYTQIMKDYIAAAETGENAGLVKVDDDLVALLNLYIETRVNILMDNEYDEALENEWLRLCWYYKTHDAQNP
ncbi:MAG: redoxin domain-containing protein [Clostridiales bacterium]|nr:redoxin domain-containing protein [Clostridiales bacterium]